MKILYVSPTGQLGGAERCLLDMLAAVLAKDPSVRTAVMTMGEGPLGEMVQRLGADHHALVLPQDLGRLGDSQGGSGWSGAAAILARIVRRSFSLALYVRRLRLAIKAFKPDLIHSNGLKSHILLTLAVPMGIPMIWHMHDYIRSRRLTRSLLRLFSPVPRLCLAVSKSVRKDAAAVFGKSKVRLLYNAVDLGTFCPGNEDGRWLDELTDLPPATTRVLRVGLIGTYAKWKGHFVFLDACASYLLTYGSSGIRFYIIGGPIYSTSGSQVSVAELEARISELGLEGVVGLIPFQSEPARTYQSLDVVVHASTAPEPYGRTIAEAMACGKAVIATRGGGAAELFVDQVEAVGVASGDGAALAAAIRKLERSPALRARLAERARAKAVAAFGTDRYGSDLLTFYFKVTASGRKKARKA